jgi:ATP-dependent Clp protease adaptor protein ClpS
MTTAVDVNESIEESIEVKEPKMYKVLLHNDNSTTFDFVITVLMQIFHKSFDEALEITQSIHLTQTGVAGTPYTREIAEEKTIETVALSRANSFPLVATFEEV